MVPHKLTLRNFMCYRDDVPTLQFDGLNVVCLSGANGAGKSALLDAITWALWGKARAKSDDELIALGQDEMEVDLEFSLGNDMYRVVRRRTKGKRGQSIVDFQMSEEGGAWRRISGDSVRDTDAQIEATLHMGYDTFVNSAFLLQGRADEFTTRKPSERKQVLANILGLDAYEELETRAKERRAKFEIEIHRVDALIESCEQRVGMRPFLEQDLAQAQDLADAAQRQFAEQETMVQALREEVGRLHRVREERIARDQQRTARVLDLEQLRQDVVHDEEQVQRAEAIIARQDEIAAGAAELARIEAQLEEFDRLREEAIKLNDRLKTADRAIEQARGQLELERRGEAAEVDRLRALADEHDIIAAELRSMEHEVVRFEGLRLEQEQYKQQAADLEQRARTIARYQREQGTLRTELERIERARDLERIAQTLPTLEHDMTTVQTQLRALDALEKQRPLLNGRVRDAVGEQRVQQSSCERLKLEGGELTRTIEQLMAGELACPACGQPVAGDARDRMLVDYRERRETMRATYRDANARVGELESVIQQANEELVLVDAAATERIVHQDRLAELKSEVSQAKKAAADIAQLDISGNTADKVTTQLAYVEEELAKLGDPDALERELVDARSILDRLEQHLRDELRLETARAGLKERLRTTQEAAQALPEAVARLAGIDDRLVREDYAHDERAERTLAQTGLNAVKEQGYSSLAHTELRGQRDEHKHWPQEVLALGQALEQVDRARRALASGRARSERLVRDIADDDLALTAMDQDLRGQRASEGALEEGERKLRTLRYQQQEAQQRLGQARQSVQECEREAELLAGYRMERVAFDEQRSIYDDLAQAWGKKGIQAMLIETAIPELEQVANDLLGRMTANQMHLMIDTQRDSKKGDTIETLDIRIADTLGTRDYTLFSGGEAFRVNFALRVALSRLLARRANASLKTLVIDEGFGSQDMNGRDRIVEAIQAISSDFERILVVTHINELKDLFPNQIEVTKGTLGSSWSLV